jgi:carboxypeptidase C (cathepsin A)
VLAEGANSISTRSHRVRFSLILGCVCLLPCATLAETGNGPQEASVHASSSQSAGRSSAGSDTGTGFHPESATSEGVANVEGHRIAYNAIAGTLVVHQKGWDDSVARDKKDGDAKSTVADPQNPDAEASIFYVAYFAKGLHAADRPITFLYNGGPGSSTVWLHMGAFGPRRVVTTDPIHSPPAPYVLIDNAYSLLDASDLVFVDAPGTGFSRIAGKDKEKAFYGVDADAYAFSQFIMTFLSQYGRWNSPKYLFGESYGTARSAVLVNKLETDNRVDVNGVMLLSQIFNFELAPDDPELNPGTDEPYVLALPTYAAIAWYHNPSTRRQGVTLEGYLREVENFACGDYASALQVGSELSPELRQAIAERVAHYVGLPVSYVLRADLRINGGMFEKNLEDGVGLTIGRNDARFSGPSMDPLSKEADYDPQLAAIGSAYISSFNAYVRATLGFGQGRVYKAVLDLYKKWNYDHQPPGQSEPVTSILNVMPDLAAAMKHNPRLKVMVNSGYYDLATPYYEAWYEDHHLPISSALQSNIEYHRYESGHMVYVDEKSLKQLHDNVLDFIRRTDNLRH